VLTATCYWAKDLPTIAEFLSNIHTAAKKEAKCLELLSHKTAGNRGGALQRKLGRGEMQACRQPPSAPGSTWVLILSLQYKPIVAFISCIPLRTWGLERLGGLPRDMVGSGKLNVSLTLVAHALQATRLYKAVAKRCRIKIQMSPIFYTFFKLTSRTGWKTV
jgi:hypothetical protein